MPRPELAVGSGKGTLRAKGKAEVPRKPSTTRGEFLRGCILPHSRGHPINSAKSYPLKVSQSGKGLTKILLPLHSKVLLVSLALMILFVLPGGLNEVVVLPRQLILSLLGGYLSFFVISQMLRDKKESFDSTVVLLITFVIWIWLVAFVSNADIGTQILGEYGRNTGLLTYTSLSILALYIIKFTSAPFEYSFSKIIAITSGVLFLYSVIQWMGLDPIPWNNQPSWIVGTFGNPNFLAAFFGISTVITVGLAQRAASGREIICFSILLVVQLIGSFMTQSRQGLMIAVAGGLIIFFLFTVKRGKKLEIIPLGISFLIIGTLALLGTLNRGPFATLFYEASVTFRGDYWRAGLAMGISNPIFGLGMDQYGENYRAFRDAAAGLRRVNDVTSNSAHNVYIDLLSGGGFPLFALYLLLTLAALFFGLRYLLRISKLEPLNVAIFAAYISYLIQSIISINQLALAFVGWILMGILLSWRNKGKDPAKDSTKVEKRSYVGLSLAVGISILLVIPPIRALSIDSRYHTLLRSGDLMGVINLVRDPAVPSNYRNYVIASISGPDSKTIKRELIEINLEIDPNDFNTLTLLRKLLVEEGELAKAEEIRKKQKVLDPFNPEIQTPLG